MMAGLLSVGPRSVKDSQADTADSSHVTIGYESGGQKEIIDGWLQDDDSVKMQVRDEPAKPK